MGFAAVIFIVGFAFQTTSMNYGMLVVARLISAIAVGMLSVISPIYISEISPPEIRGALLIFSKSLRFQGCFNSTFISCHNEHWVASFEFPRPRGHSWPCPWLNAPPSLAH